MIEDLRKVLELLDELENLYGNFPRYDDDFSLGRDAIRDLRITTTRALRWREQEMFRNGSLVTISKGEVTR